MYENVAFVALVALVAFVALVANVIEKLDNLQGYPNCIIGYAHQLHHRSLNIYYRASSTMQNSQSQRIT